MTINEEVLKQIHMAYSWGTYSNTFKHTLEQLYRKDLIDVEFKEMDLNRQTWGGAMNIIMKEGMTTRMMVNAIIAFCHADEISMESDTVLRLWWD
jgi:NCAIR mutase (PurE)-related protein